MSRRLIARLLLVWMALSLAGSALWAAEFRKLDPVLAPPLVLKDLNGNTHDLTAYRGKAVLVNFWASWCPPCREEMPSMQRLKQKMAGRPFAILGVGSGEDASDSVAFLEKVKIGFTVLPDPDGVVTKRWKVYGLPTSFLIDADGRVRYVLTGPTEWDERGNLLLIESLFQ